MVAQKPNVPAPKHPTPEVVTVGTVAFDTIRTPQATGERLLGGSALYFALGARFLSRVGLVGAIGNDFQDATLHKLSGLGIDVAGLQRLPKHRTFSWEGRYLEDFSRRETIHVDVKIFEAYTPRLPERWRGAPFLFLANGSPAHQLAVLEAAADARCVVSDSMNLWIETDRPGVERVFARSHGVVLTDEEARQFTGEPGLLRAARRILALGPRFAVIKKGEHGALCLSQEGCLLVPAYPVEAVVDPTGAGDSFAGGLVSYLASRADGDMRTLREALLWGTAVGSLCVETLGPERLLSVDRAGVESRLNILRRMIEGER